MKEIKDYEGDISFISSIADNPNFSDEMRNKADALTYYIKEACKPLEPISISQNEFNILCEYYDYTPVLIDFDITWIEDKIGRKIKFLAK